MEFKKLADFLWPIGATVLALLGMPLAIEQYPEFFKENRWPLPISLVAIVICWIIPLFLHERAKGIIGWVISFGWGGRSIAVTIVVATLIALTIGGVRLFRFHTHHLASVLHKKEIRPEILEQKHEESKNEPPIQSPPTTKKKTSAKPTGKSEPPAFAVAVETKMMVPSPSKNIAGTGLWALSRMGGSCYLRSADTAMFIRIKNLQSEKVIITAYNVYAMGEELPRIRMDMNSPFLVLKTGVIPRNFQGVIPFQMPAPSGNAGGGFFQVPFKDSDFSAAATVQAELLDRQLGEHYIEPSATVRGWAFFEYSRRTFLPVSLTIKISDDLGHTFLYPIPDEPGNPSGDTLQRLLNFGPVVDLSSCIRQPHPVS